MRCLCPDEAIRSDGTIDTSHLDLRANFLEIKGTSVRSLRGLPASFTGISLRACQQLTDFSGLPESITHVDILFCPGLATLKGLPPDLAHINISRCVNFTSLQQSFQDLDVFKLDSCPRAADLSGLPEFMERINLFNCPGVTTLSELPKAVKELSVAQCANLENLRDMPSEIWFGHIGNCAALRDLQGIPGPDQVKQCITIRMCPNIIRWPAYVPASWFADQHQCPGFHVADINASRIVDHLLNGKAGVQLGTDIVNTILMMVTPGYRNRQDVWNTARVRRHLGLTQPTQQQEDHGEATAAAAGSKRKRIDSFSSDSQLSEQENSQPAAKRLK
jgi:hypothetical protein